MHDNARPGGRALNAVFPAGFHLAVIEDDVFIRTLFVRQAEQSGLGVDAFDSVDALAAQAGDVRVPDLVLLDYFLGDTDAAAVLHQLRAVPGWADVPVALFSGAASELLAPALGQPGVVGVVAKGGRMSETLANLAQLIARLPTV